MRPPPTHFLGTPATAPGPDGPAMLRDLSAIRHDPLAFLARMWRHHGDVVQFPIPRPPTYLLSDPGDVRRILLDRRHDKATLQYRTLALVSGEGLLVADGDRWRRQRRLVQPAFHRETLVSVGEQVAEALARLVSRLASGPSIVDVDREMQRLSIDVVGRSLFGADLTGDADRLASATLDGLDVVVARARVPIPQPGWVPTASNRRLRRARRTLDDAVARMVAQRRAAGSARPSDMLGLLLAARDEDGSALTPVELRDEVVTFIVAGYETVASALTWSLGLLAAHPDAMARLQGEADEVLGLRLPTFADTSRLPFARAVLDETLRLYPPAWLLTRRLGVDEVAAGSDLPARSLVILSPWIVHRHPSAWPDPEVFRPDRMLGGGAERGAFIPFGAGPRMCIGRDVAYVEAVAALAALAARFDIGVAGPAVLPRADAGVTLRPVGGMPLVVQARSG